MIKSERGKVNVRGSVAEILADFTAVIKVVKDMLMEIMPEEEVREEIADCQELALKSDEEIKEEIEREKAMIEQAKAEFELERIGRRYEN